MFYWILMHYNITGYAVVSTCCVRRGEVYQLATAGSHTIRTWGKIRLLHGRHGVDTTVRSVHALRPFDLVHIHEASTLHSSADTLTHLPPFIHSVVTDPSCICLFFPVLCSRPIATLLPLSYHHPPQLTPCVWNHSSDHGTTPLRSHNSPMMHDLIAALPT